MVGVGQVVLGSFLFETCGRHETLHVTSQDLFAGDPCCIKRSQLPLLGQFMSEKCNQTHTYAYATVAC